VAKEGLHDGKGAAFELLFESGFDLFGMSYLTGYDPSFWEHLMREARFSHVCLTGKEGKARLAGQGRQRHIYS